MLIVTLTGHLAPSTSCTQCCCAARPPASLCAAERVESCHSKPSSVGGARRQYTTCQRFESDSGARRVWPISVAVTFATFISAIGVSCSELLCSDPLLVCVAAAPGANSCSPRRSAVRPLRPGTSRRRTAYTFNAAGGRQRRLCSALWSLRRRPAGAPHRCSSISSLLLHPQPL